MGNINLFPENIIVYTTLLGDYERLIEQPVAKQSKVRFVAITDNPHLVSETWETFIYPQGFKHDANRESRRAKISPHLFFPDVDISIYIDNSVQLKMIPEQIVHDLLDKKTDFVCFKHPWRTCLYEEALEVLKSDMDTYDRVLEQINHYRKDEYPQQNGLIAGFFLLRKHNNDNTKKVMTQWFEHVLRYSRRDQLSFNYVAWKNSFEFCAIDSELIRNKYLDWPVITDRKREKQKSVKYRYTSNINQLILLANKRKRDCFKIYRNAFREIIQKL